MLSGLEELADLLRAAGEEGWAERLGQVRAGIDGEQPAALQELVDMIGRPGDNGLNDLVIHPLRGHTVEEDDLDEINQRLGLLTTTSFRLARGLQRQDP